MLHLCQTCKSEPVVARDPFGGVLWYITCIKCFTGIPAYRTREEAIERWNLRNAPVKRNLPLL